MGAAAAICFQDCSSAVSAWGVLVGTPWPPWSVWAVGVVYTAVTLLAVAGFFFAPRPGVRLFALAYLALTMAVHVAVIVVWRYRVAYWDPVFLLYGVFLLNGTLFLISGLVTWVLRPRAEVAADATQARVILAGGGAV